MCPVIIRKQSFRFKLQQILVTFGYIKLTMEEIFLVV